jgi:hypothetical protein
VNGRHVPDDRRLPSTVEVNGFVVLGYLRSAADTSPTFGERFERQLATRGITDPEIDGWYPAAAFQDALFETAEAVGEETLVAAGETMATLSDWPEHVSTPRDALVEMDDSHDRAHRNVAGVEIGGYDIRRLSADDALIDCGQFPYPVPVAQGAIRGSITLFTTDSRSVSVRRVTDDERDPAIPTFEATW